jgi:hypothetical protein
VWCNPIEAGKNQAIEIAEGEPLRRISSQHVELVANATISASREASDRKSPTTTQQINVSMSPRDGTSLDSRLYGKDNREPFALMTETRGLSELAAAQLMKLTGRTVELKSSPLRPGALS